MVWLIPSDSVSPESAPPNAWRRHQAGQSEST